MAVDDNPATICSNGTASNQIFIVSAGHGYIFRTDTDVSMTNDHSCWVCAHQQIGGDSFLGLCKWFETKGQPKKPIPPEVVDVGCKFYTFATARYWATHEVE